MEDSFPPFIFSCSFSIDQIQQQGMGIMDQARQTGMGAFNQMRQQGMGALGQVQNMGQQGFQQVSAIKLPEVLGMWFKSA